ncbi:hypothetical protein Tco_0879205 [Tanacetum coccineum]
MENSQTWKLSMQDKLRLSKSQGASTPADIQAHAKLYHILVVVQLCDLHWTTVKNILKYLRNTKDMFLVYRGDLKRELRLLATLALDI